MSAPERSAATKAPGVEGSHLVAGERRALGEDDDRGPRGEARADGAHRRRAAHRVGAVDEDRPDGARGRAHERPAGEVRAAHHVPAERAQEHEDVGRRPMVGDDEVPAPARRRPSPRVSTRTPKMREQARTPRRATQRSRIASRSRRADPDAIAVRATNAGSMDGRQRAEPRDRERARRSSSLAAHHSLRIAYDAHSRPRRASDRSRHALESMRVGRPEVALEPGAHVAGERRVLHGEVDLEVLAPRALVEVVAADRGERVVDDRGLRVEHRPGSVQISTPWRSSVSKSASTANCTTGTSLFAGTSTRTRAPRAHGVKERRAHPPVGHEVRVGDVDALRARRRMRTRYSRWMLRRVRHWLASTQTGRVCRRDRRRTSGGGRLARELAPRAEEERAQLLRRLAPDLDDVVAPPRAALVERAAMASARLIPPVNAGRPSTTSSLRWSRRSTRSSRKRGSKRRDRVELGDAAPRVVSGCHQAGVMPRLPTASWMTRTFTPRAGALGERVAEPRARRRRRRSSTSRAGSRARRAAMASSIAGNACAPSRSRRTGSSPTWNQSASRAISAFLPPRAPGARRRSRGLRRAAPSTPARGARPARAGRRARRRARAR